MQGSLDVVIPCDPIMRKPNNSANSEFMFSAVLSKAFFAPCIPTFELHQIPATVAVPPPPLHQLRGYRC